jgi:large subunit ribosomal protein L10
MPKTRQEKVGQLEKMSERMRNAKGIAFVSFSGITVNDFDGIRNDLIEKETKIQVTKKRLLKIAGEQQGVAIPTDTFPQEVVTFFSTDETTAARVAKLTAKSLKGKEWQIVGGVLEGKYMDAEQVTRLAELPTKHELLGQLVGTLKGPQRGFVWALSGNLRNLVGVLNAIREKQAA